ncbi:hypothetical protein ABZP36_011607 [Zizania latifolia]
MGQKRRWSHRRSALFLPPPVLDSFFVLSFLILVRKANNWYSWIGFGGVPMALRELKMSDDEDEDKMGDGDGDTESEKSSQPVDNLLASLAHLDAGLDLVGLLKSVCWFTTYDFYHRKEKSLGLLTQNFVKIFLTMELCGCCNWIEERSRTIGSLSPFIFDGGEGQGPYHRRGERPSHAWNCPKTLGVLQRLIPSKLLKQSKAYVMEDATIQLTAKEVMELTEALNAALIANGLL